jgi:SAM-dependent methyltransferase
LTRRKGDTISIDGGYQHRAIMSGNAVQRFWHETKQWAITDMLPPRADDFALDVGCGSGVISSFLGRTARRVVGIDGNIEATAYAQKTFGSDNVSFMRGLVDESLVLDEPVDKIYCLEVVEHIHREQGVEMLSNFRKLLHDDGRVFLTTPNYRSLWPLIEWGMDGFGLAPRMAGDQHVSHYSPALLCGLCREAGFRVEKLATVSFVAPWVAPLNWNLAARCHRIESRFRCFPGSIIVCVLAPTGPSLL